MKTNKIFACALVALVIAVGIGIPKVAEAAPVWKTALTSNDGGSTNTVTIQAQTVVDIQCDNPACVKFGTGTLSLDCSKDFVLMGKVHEDGTDQLFTSTGADGGLTLTNRSNSVSYFSLLKVETGSATSLAARALDGGNPLCRQLLETQNLPR